MSTIRPSRCCASACCCPATCRSRAALAELRLLRRQGGEALSGLQRPGADRHRRQAHDRGPQRPGGVAPEAAQDQSGAPHGALARRPRKQIRAGQHPRGPDRGGRQRPHRVAARRRGRQDRPADADPQLGHPRAQLQRGVAPAADRDREGPDPQGPGDGAARPERARQIQHRCLRRRRQEARSRPRSTGARQPPRASPTSSSRAPTTRWASSRSTSTTAHSVYMHDTPSQSLFGRNFRAASSGCVRVHGHRAAGRLAAGRPGLEARARHADEGDAASAST